MASATILVEVALETAYRRRDEWRLAQVKAMTDRNPHRAQICQARADEADYIANQIRSLQTQG